MRGVLVCSTACREQKEREPRHANLRPHLQVEHPDAWVEPRPHEEVVEDAVRHPLGVARDPRSDVDGKCNRVRGDYRRDHERAEPIVDRLQGEDTGEVQCGDAGQCQPPGGESIAAVNQLLAAARRDRQPLDLQARNKGRHQSFHDQERPVDHERAPRRRRVRNDLLPDPRTKRAHVGHSSRKEDGAVVEAPRDPEIEHQRMRDSYDDAGPERAPELARGLVILVRRHALLADSCSVPHSAQALSTRA